MKRKNRFAIIAAVVTIILIALAVIIYRVLQDENKFTIIENKYITEQASNLIDVNVVNDVSVFGNAGKGLFYDFLTSFEEKEGLKFNKITINSRSSTSGLTLNHGNAMPDGAKEIYVDHYVLIGKSYSVIESPKSISGNIGILTGDAELINKFLSGYTLTLTNYETHSELETALNDGTVDYILVPRIEFLDTLLTNLYSIVYHFSDIKDYYYMSASNNEVLTSILNKYYNIWSAENFDTSFNQNEFDTFTDKLKITEKELDVINNKEYIYGFVENAPYDVKSGGSYGGVMFLYLNGFSKFSGITFNYKNYRNLSKLKLAIGKNQVNIYTDYYGIDSSYNKLDSVHTMDISIVASNKDERTFKSLDALVSKTVYAKENTLVSKYLDNNGIFVKNYKNTKNIKKLLKSNEIIAMDYLDYVLYKSKNENASERFRVNTNVTYNIYSNNDTMFNRLFTYYTSTLDKEELIYSGVENYNKTVLSGTLIYKVTEYAFALIVIIAGISYIVYRFGKRVHIKKRIKKADKMKYIDLLTSLKNRNFLNENLPIWNQNTIYPQSVIIIDINGLQDLNDTYGYLEGDRQIQALANILIKTQLDNTEIMRTDGNEFTIYMIGYSERQVLSYIKKLNKEFKNLPHDDRGAAIGFAMITDDVKLIDDAINEATEVMKKNKELMNGDDDVENS